MTDAGKRLTALIADLGDAIEVFETDKFWAEAAVLRKAMLAIAELGKQVDLLESEIEEIKRHGEDLDFERDLAS